ncbi:MAG TPA: SAM-dependent methyltransferase [Pseudonocardiaceae bacterium]|jgi:hypothetical protein|nr:SAM-dependent methyltransferase [Pseudonocardiaceae bacterium]
MSGTGDDHERGGLPDPSGIDISRPSTARIYDYWLGGSHNFASDREVGERAANARPALRPTAWANRVLDSDRLRDILDLDQPVAILLISVLHFISDDDDPAGIVRAYRDRVAAGSYLALSHGIRDGSNPGGQTSAVSAYQRVTRVPVVVRTTWEIGAWFDGLGIEPPGLVRVNEWRPDADTATGLIAQVGPWPASRHDPIFRVML